MAAQQMGHLHENWTVAPRVTGVCVRVCVWVCVVVVWWCVEVGVWVCVCARAHVVFVCVFTFPHLNGGYMEVLIEADRGGVGAGDVLQLGLYVLDVFLKELHLPITNKTTLEHSANAILELEGSFVFCVCVCVCVSRIIRVRVHLCMSLTMIPM